MRRVFIANPYSSMDMSSLGDGCHVLYRQVRFPLEYDPDVDLMLVADHDRLLSWDHKAFQQACQDFIGAGELMIGQWAIGAAEGRFLDFLAAILQADTSVAWTGGRVLGSVHLGNGYPVFTLELFANRSGVKVYTGQDAPNVKRQKRRSTNYGD